MVDAQHPEIEGTCPDGRHGPTFRAKIENHCGCGDCYHPSFVAGPGEDDLWDRCADCGCGRTDHLGSHAPEQVNRPESCLCRDPLREVHSGCPLHGHSPEQETP